MTELLFWSCVGFAAYAYFGYPAAVALVAWLRPRPVRRAPITPSVSFIITAHNERTRIEAKILNTLAVDYPRDRLEIIVASDCSTDDTHAIVGRYAAEGVRLVVSPRRGGKEAAQGLAVNESRGDILVFSDVATQLEPGGVNAILLPFADPSVGCVSSVDKVVDRDGKVTGEGAYVRYEMLLRSLESQAGTVVGLSGSFFAARREVCKPWTVDLPSDFITLLNTVKLGLRGISEPAALGFYKNVADDRREYRPEGPHRHARHRRPAATPPRSESVPLRPRVVAALQPQAVPMAGPVCDDRRIRDERGARPALHVLFGAGPHATDDVRGRGHRNPVAL